MGQRRIGIVTSAEREGGYRKTFADYPDLNIVKLEFETSVSPDLLDRLTEWDQLGFDIAVIEDAACRNKRAMINDIHHFQLHPRSPEGKLRIIFVGDKSRAAKDPDIAVLAKCGIYDFVLPYRGEVSFDNLVNRIYRPGKLSDVVTLLDTGEDPIEKVEHAQRVADIRERTHRVRPIISVASISEHSGCTNYVCTTAQQLALLGNKVGVVVPKKTFEAFATHFPSCVTSSERSVRLAIKGEDGVRGTIEFFCGHDASSVPAAGFDYVVVDTGYIPWHKPASMSVKERNERAAKKFSDRMQEWEAMSEKAKNCYFARSDEQQNRLLAFNRGDVRIVYCSVTDPERASDLRCFLQNAEDLDTYVLVVYGLVHEQMWTKITSEIKKISPYCKIVAADTYLWPLLDTARRPEVLEAIETCLPIDECTSTVSGSDTESAPAPERRGGIFSLFRGGDNG